MQFGHLKGLHYGGFFLNPLCPLFLFLTSLALSTTQPLLLAETNALRLLTSLHPQIGDLRLQGGTGYGVGNFQIDV